MGLGEHFGFLEASARRRQKGSMKGSCCESQPPNRTPRLVDKSKPVESGGCSPRRAGQSKEQQRCARMRAPVRTTASETPCRRRERRAACGQVDSRAQ
eukprot:1967301-Pleurochrysis_carterae.AAC.1